MRSPDPQAEHYQMKVHRPWDEICTGELGESCATLNSNFTMVDDGFIVGLDGIPGIYIYIQMFVCW